MVIGIPKGLMYYNYEKFITRFFDELSIDTIVSQDTSKEILNLGIKYCVDEACLPIKIFHGHVAWLRDKSDLIVVPRIMKTESNHFICPKFCGLPETIKADIPNLPLITNEPLYMNSRKNLYKWCEKLAKSVNKKNKEIKNAFNEALLFYNNNKVENRINDNKLTIMFAGHPYNVKDKYTNMNLISKLDKLGINTITEDLIDKSSIYQYSNRLKKKPFWSFMINNYCTCIHVAENNIADGIIYISSFGCGIDSICIELIKSELPEFPILVLKVDEQTGAEGMNTRIEAFIDMLEKKIKVKN